MAGCVLPLQCVLAQEPSAQQWIVTLNVPVLREQLPAATEATCAPPRAETENAGQRLDIAAVTDDTRNKPKSLKNTILGAELAIRGEANLHVEVQNSMPDLLACEGF